MCEKCRVEATGLRVGPGTSILSKIFGRFACRHTPDCACEDCEKYRSRNKYADFGLTGSRERKK